MQYLHVTDDSSSNDLSSPQDPYGKSGHLWTLSRSHLKTCTIQEKN